MEEELTEDQKQYCANFYPKAERIKLAANRDAALFYRHAFCSWIPEKKEFSTARIVTDQTAYKPDKMHRKCMRCGYEEEREW